MTLRQDYESSSSKLKALDKQVKALRQEKEDIHKVTPPPIFAKENENKHLLVQVILPCLSLFSSFWCLVMNMTLSKDMSVAAGPIANANQ